MEEQLKLLRQKRGWTQQQLATHLGVSRYAVMQWERGEAIPTGKNYEALNHLFNRKLTPTVQEQAVGLITQLRQLHQQHNDVIRELEALVGGAA